MTGWKLVVVLGNQVNNFPAGYVIDPWGLSVVESYTLAVTNSYYLFWSSSAIWANTGDKAELRNASNEVVSSSCYGSGCP
jgi:hypothetical protein